MQIFINKADLAQAEEFVQSGGLVDLMNERGLSINSMAIILDLLFKGFEDLNRQLEGDNEDDTEI